MTERFNRIMERARAAGCLFSDNDVPVVRVEKILKQLNIPHCWNESLYDTVEKIDCALTEREQPPPMKQSRIRELTGISESRRIEGRGKSNN